MATRILNRLALPLALLLLEFSPTLAQARREDIYSDFVLYQRRVALERDLRDRIIARNFSLQLDSSTEDKYLSSCWAVSQFLFFSPQVDKGFLNLFRGYDSLSFETKKALLEAIYAVAPRRYATAVQAVLEKELDPHLFALCAVYLFRTDTTTMNSNALKIRMVEKFPDYDSLPLLRELQDYLSYHFTYLQSKTPDISSLFANQQRLAHKTVYSFQRWNRDYAGLAIVQNADGRFARDGQGRILVFEQLARSGSGLPYFLTNGNTPQGIYSIQGTGVSRTNFIGPTPNLQLLLPFEGNWARYFQTPSDSTGPYIENPEAIKGFGTGNDSLSLYRELLPAEWREYQPIMQAWNAGRIGRTEIIAHGTTIDPEFFRDKPFYPLTPTMGCLCAKELWNPTTGHLLVSEQFNLVSAFLATPGKKGYLYVVDVDDQHKPVTRAEVEQWVQTWEKRGHP